ncbi:hypothetical protein MKZ38_008528 [Zalerion maritima]|uniref:Uncharacterized protein n=1 Tax=Zalerion maritima TaxID=339359 RepID=A0AAD5RU49_9PEZI|nr:hypothetical protein MKZ38_008528 [Zalerion maritima]
MRTLIAFFGLLGTGVLLVSAAPVTIPVPAVITRFSVTRTEFVVIPTPSLVEKPPIITLPGDTTVMAECSETSIKKAQTITEADRTYTTVETLKRYQCPYPTCLACLQPPPNGCGAACWGARPCEDCKTTSCSKCTYETTLAQAMTGIVIIESPSTLTITVDGAMKAEPAMATGAAGLEGEGDTPPEAPAPTEEDEGALTYVPGLGISVPVYELTRSVLVIQDGSLITGIDAATDSRPATFIPGLGITIAFEDLMEPLTALQQGDWGMDLKGGELTGPSGTVVTKTSTATATPAAPATTTAPTPEVMADTETNSYATLSALGLTIPVDELTQQVSIYSGDGNTATETRSYTVVEPLGITVPVDELSMQFGPATTPSTDTESSISAYDGGGIGAATEVAAPFSTPGSGGEDEPAPPPETEAETGTSTGAQTVGATDEPAMVGTNDGDTKGRRPSPYMVWEVVGFAALVGFALV